MIKCCGTCTYWHTDKGYECSFAGFYGCYYDNKTIPYCNWKKAKNKKIKQNRELLNNSRGE